MEIDLNRYRPYLNPNENGTGYVVSKEKTPDDILQELQEIAKKTNDYYKTDFIAFV